MEALIVFIILILVLMVGGAIAGIVALVRVSALLREVAQLRKNANQQSAPVRPRKSEAAIEVKRTPETDPIEAAAQTRPAPQQPIVIEPVGAIGPTPTPAVKAAGATSVPVRKKSPFVLHLTENWMVWLGGLCVALAGIFLAKYSIEQGLLGPLGRVTLGLLTGLSLHGVALWLRARFGAFPALAALAGGGSITLFAALLAALHFYQMFSPITVFVLLALVALATMWLALQHGPVLATIGMIGAYAVPVMVSTGSGNVLAAMMYALIISASVLLLIRQLKVLTLWYTMLWWGLMAGGLFWWAVSLTTSQPDGWRGLYLAVFAYGLIAFSQSNWHLTKQVVASVWPFSESAPNAGQQDGAAENDAWLKAQEWLAPSLLLLVAAQVVTVFSQGWQSQSLNWSLLAGVLLWVAGKQPKFAGLAWLLFMGEWLAILLPQLDSTGGQFFFRPLPPESIPAFFAFILSFAAVFLILALHNLSQEKAKNWWAAMVALVPVLTLLICHLLGASYTADWQWATAAIIMGACYIFLAVKGIEKQWTQELYIWLFLAGHFAYSYAASLLFEQATLTLAISVQVLSIAWLIQRFDVSHMGWLLKAVVVLVVVRLTLNPWLESYPADAHWPVWTYGGATLFCFVATRWLAENRALARWTEAAALHLFVLTLWSEARYWLYDGETFYNDYTFKEAVLNCLLFGALALVYQYKAKVSETLGAWYRNYSLLQLLFAAVNYAGLLLAFFTSDPWAYASVGSTPIWNILFIAYGVPVVLGYFVYRFYSPEFRKVAAIVAAFGGFVFVSMEIRHLWQGSIRLDSYASVGELYTYSIVWLLLAVAALLLGSWKYGKACYQGGLIVMALVVVKIFLVDMAGLDGLLRVASFMGLGLALLAVAFLHQKLTPKFKV